MSMIELLAEPMSLREPKDSKRVPRNYRLSPDVLEYLEATSKSLDWPATKVLETDLRFSRDLSIELNDLGKEIRATAKAGGLDINEHMAKVVGGLVREAIEARRKKSKR
jgi:hypothetical protein